MDLFAVGLIESEARCNGCAGTCIALSSNGATAKH